MSDRQCPFCGKSISSDRVECPFCQKELPQFHQPLHFRNAASRAQMRRGMLWMLMAAVFYFFAAGYSPLQVPVPLAPMLTDWVLPLLFLGGLGLTAYGLVGYFSG